jgi:DNA-binding MarR family transcriptional regulator
MTRSNIDKVKKIVMPARSSPGGAGDVRDLLMFRIARLSTLGDRMGQLRISRQFGLNLGEWRALGVIHALAPVTLATLAREMYLDKGQLSRSISNLIAGGLVAHSASRRDRRQTIFALTAEGRRLHGRVLAYVIGRNAQYTRSLASSERAELLRLLDKVTAGAAVLYEQLFDSQTMQPIEPDRSRAPSRAKPQGKPQARRTSAQQASRKAHERPGARAVASRGG